MKHVIAKTKRVAWLWAVAGAAMLWTGLAAKAGSGSDPSFRSAFETTPDRVWLGAEYWPNPMEDWRVRDGRLEVTKNGSDRNVHVLTRALGTAHGPFRVSVELGLLHRGSHGSAGFRVGVRDPDIDDYRGNVFFGKGIDVGIDVAGRLLLAGKTAVLSQETDLEHVRLVLRGRPTPNTDSYTLTLTAHDVREGDDQPLGGLTVDGIAPIALTGNLALVNNHGQAGSRFWFNHWQLDGPRVRAHPDRAFGPILWSMYTLSDSRSERGHVMSIQAQMPPLGDDDNDRVILEVKRGDAWVQLGEGTIHPEARNAVIHVENWPADRDVPYRLVYETLDTEGEMIRDEWHGTIRKDPVDEGKLVLASLNCLFGQGFPHEPVAANVARIDPDMLAFQGDQLYEPDGGYGAIRFPQDEGRERAIVNYLRKYYMFGWPFRELMRDRPTLCLLDDHDVYQGNLWGMGGAPGEADPREAESWNATGGYYMPPWWVNIVHRIQTAHHPDFYDPTPIQRGITVWYGDMVYGGVSFAILSDRMFKSSPLRVEHDGDRPDLVTDGDLDPASLDRPGLELLGDRQMAFLEHWVRDWRGASMKVVLSQAPLTNSNTHHSQDFTRYHIDLDAHGWPQTARNEAVALLRRAGAFHISGDQHLPSLIKYGIEDFGDAIWGFCAPAVSTGWPRWWAPDLVGMTRHGPSLHSLPNTGDYYDGTGHPIHVHAVGNPVALKGETRYQTAHVKSSGFGVVRLDTRTRRIHVEAYRFLVNVSDPTHDAQFPGWPHTVHQLDNLGPEPIGYLPAVAMEGVAHPVVKVHDADRGELVYAIRAPAASFRPPVFRPGTYTVTVGDDEADRWEINENLQPTDN